MNIDLLEERNNKYLEKLINKFKIEKSVEDLTDMSSVYITIDKDRSIKEVDVVNRIRLMGAENIYESVAGIKRIVKTKKVQLYTINNKTIKELSENNELSTVVNNLDYICSLVKELQLFREIREMEKVFIILDSEKSV